MRNYTVLTMCFLLFSSSPAFADFYRWVDNDGREFYTNDINQIPQEHRSSASIVKTDAARVSVGERPSAPAAPLVTAKEHRDRYGKGEEYWRKRAANLRLKLRDQQDDYELVLKQLDELDLKPKKLTSMRKKFHSSLEKKKMKLEKDMAKTRRMLEVTLPEEARKADAYPGWLRE